MGSSTPAPTIVELSQMTAGTGRYRVVMSTEERHRRKPRNLVSSGTCTVEMGTPTKVQQARVPKVTGDARRDVIWAAGDTSIWGKVVGVPVPDASGAPPSRPKVIWGTSPKSSGSPPNGGLVSSMGHNFGVGWPQGPRTAVQQNFPHTLLVYPIYGCNVEVCPQKCHDTGRSSEAWLTLGHGRGKSSLAGMSAVSSRWLTCIIDFPDLGSTYNGG